MSVPRLRMFAGPNGSGKSTIKGVIDPAILGIYINPDDIQRDAASQGFLSFKDYEVVTDADEVTRFFLGSPLLRRAGLHDEVKRLTFKDGRIVSTDLDFNAYFASVTADFLRNKLIEAKKSVSFETVMSSPDKVDLLKKAQRAGYRTYLYYVATEDPEINIARVKSRVLLGGHDVPTNKIVERYERSLSLLLEALKHTDRAFLFDNSADGREHVWVAEVTGGRDLQIRCNPMPHWFETFVWAKVQPQG